MKLAQKSSRQLPFSFDKFMREERQHHNHHNAGMSEGRRAIDTMSSKFSAIILLRQNNSDFYELAIER